VAMPEKPCTVNCGLSAYPKARTSASRRSIQDLSVTQVWPNWPDRPSRANRRLSARHDPNQTITNRDAATRDQQCRPI
jgi:hypothetical protein